MSSTNRGKTSSGGPPPPAKPTPSPAQEGFDPNRCSICLETLEDPATVVDCGHVFCHECIAHWVRQRNRCPLCRQVCV